MSHFTLLRQRIADVTASATLIGEVERRHELSVDEFVERYAKRSVPVIICGAMETWAARSWTPERLKALFGELVIRCVPSHSIGRGHAATRRASNRELGEYTLSEYIDLLQPSREGAEVPHAANMELPELVGRYLELPAYFPAEGYSQPRTWLGPNDTVTRLHCDTVDNLTATVFGGKRYVLIPPHQSPFLYCSDPLPGMGPRVCAVDAEAPDLEMFPLYAKATPVVCEPAPGEMLFIPAHWFHQVRNVGGITIAFNFFVHNLAPWAVPDGGKPIASALYLEALEEFHRTNYLALEHLEVARASFSTLAERERRGELSAASREREQNDVIQRILRLVKPPVVEASVTPTVEY